MSKNDAKVKELINLLAKKKESVGARPAKTFKTNGLVDMGDKKVNLNTISDIVDLVPLLARNSELSWAVNDLKMNCQGLDDYFHLLRQQREDIMMVADIIAYNQGKRELDKMQQRLDALLSDDAKIEDELSSIEKLLK